MGLAIEKAKSDQFECQNGRFVDAGYFSIKHILESEQRVGQGGAPFGKLVLIIDISAKMQEAPDGEEGEDSQENSHEIKGQVDFREGDFDKAPTVLVALSQFELAGGKDLRVSVEVENVSESGFSWVIRKWHCATVCSTSADNDQVHGGLMQMAHSKVQKLLILPLGINPPTLDPFITSILVRINESKSSNPCQNRSEHYK